MANPDGKYIFLHMGCDTDLGIHAAQNVLVEVVDVKFAGLKLRGTAQDQERYFTEYNRLDKEVNRVTS